MGVSQEEITKALVANSWQVTDINDAFAVFAGPSPVPQPSQSAVVSAQAQGGIATLMPVGQLFSESWKLYKRRFLVLATLIAIPDLLTLVGQLFYLNGTTLSGILSLIIFWLALASFVPALAGIVTALSSDTSFFDSFRQGMRSFFPLLWVGILLGLIFWGGMIMFIIPGVMMMVWFSFSGFTFVIEGKRGLNALLQSREYVRGYWWALFGRVVVMSAVILIPIFAVQYATTVVFGKAVATITYVLISIVITPLGMAYSYKLYQNMTALKPGLAATTPTSGRGFLITSAILGLVAPILIAIGVIFLISSMKVTTGSMPISAAPAAESSATSSVMVLAATPYLNTTNGYRITPPAGWQGQSTDSVGRNTVVFSAPAPNLSQAGITVVTQKSNTAVTTKAQLDVAVQKVIAIYKIVMPNFKVLSETDSNIGSAPASLVLFTSDDKSGAQVESSLLLVAKGSQLYEVFTQAAGRDSSAYEGLFQSVIASFSFTL